MRPPLRDQVRFLALVLAVIVLMYVVRWATDSDPRDYGWGSLAGLVAGSFIEAASRGLRRGRRR